MATSSANEIPVFFGVRYAAVHSPNGELYGAAELGIVTYNATVDMNGTSTSDSQTNVAGTLGVGFRAGKVDVRGGLWLPDLGRVGDALAVMATVGVDVAAL
jgi:hypothetical protein